MKVLLIDDCAADAELMRIALKAAIPPISRIDDVREVPGVQGLKGYDLVILDLGLPTHVGASAMEALRARAPRVPVIVCTGQQNPDVLSEVRALGGTVVGKSAIDALAPAVREAGQRISEATPAPEDNPDVLGRKIAKALVEALEGGAASESGVRRATDRVREHLERCDKETHRCAEAPYCPDRRQA